MALSGNSHRLLSIPNATAASTEHSTSAAAWSTFHCEHIAFVYGVAIMRLAAEAVAMPDAVRGDQSQAHGLLPATSANPS